MKTQIMLSIIFLMTHLWLVPTVQSQVTSSRSNYIFRFNVGISTVFLNDMVFEREQDLNLGSCTTREKLNGPLTCAINCQNQSVCILELTGPSGSTVNDVLEKVSETSVQSLHSSTESQSPDFQTSYPTPNEKQLNEQRRIDLYNSTSSISKSPTAPRN
jgi:hypothetical protein